MKKFAAVALVATFLLAGCAQTERRVPAQGSVEEAQFILACNDLGGTFVPGEKTSGSSFNSACEIRYPGLLDD